MTATDLMSIGAFARRVGLTASALRFYDDAELFSPDHVDPMTNYRYYDESRIETAARIRDLRRMGMPLSGIKRLLDADADEAIELIDEQIRVAAAGAESVRQVGERLKIAVRQPDRQGLCRLPGPMFAAAIDQTLPSTVDDPEFPVLGGVRMEVGAATVALTSTDRYRLTRRTLVPIYSSTESWAGTLDRDSLQRLMSRLRRSPTVELAAVAGVSPPAVTFVFLDGETSECRLVRGDFPDHEQLVSSLPDVSHRLTLVRRDLMEACESTGSGVIGIHIRSDGVVALRLDDKTLAQPGRTSGSPLTVWFAVTTLYPALCLAVGSDLLLDLRGQDRPASVRSADDGDLTTLVMPREPVGFTGIKRS